MAAPESYMPVQVVNVDLALERQNLIREKMGEFFSALSRRARVKKRMVYTVNTDEAPLEKVLRMNEEADALFTSFNYDAVHSEQFKEQITVETPQEILEVDPQLRYPMIAELLRHAGQGDFRHKKLILVGDLHEKVSQFIRSALPVSLTVFTNPERSQISPPIQITSIDRITADPKAPLVEGEPIPVSTISALEVADVVFQGVINMPEEGNRFVFKDQTIVDTARKLYLSEGVQSQMVRERVAEEKLTFVHGKKVFILLEPDLEHVISDRFTFDRMEHLYKHHTMEEALHTLDTGKGQTIVEFFERDGYDLVFSLLDQDERDKLLLVILGDRLPRFLAKEIETVKPMISHLEEGDLESLFYNLPPAVADQTLEGLKAKNYDRFLAMVPPRIRESVILRFLANRDQVGAAWKGVSPEEKTAFLAKQNHLIHAMIYLLNTPLSKQKFPGLKFSFEKNFNSAMLAKMSAEEQKSTFATLASNIETVHPNPSLLTAQLKPEELDAYVTQYILRNPNDFYNRLNPLVRKQVWLSVGREYRDEISGTLHALDKIEILQGNKETTVGLIFNNTDFLNHLTSGDEAEFSAALFLTLKKLNKTESKNALLKKALTESEWRERRIKGVPALLANPDNAAIYDKLADHVEDLAFRFDSLVCTKAHFGELMNHEALAGAVVTLVDDLVDPSLFNLFQEGKLSRSEYDAFSSNVEKEIADLRRKMAAQEGEDPVGIYILETMLMLNQLSNRAMTGELGPEAMEELDERINVRQRLLDGMKEQVRRIDDFLVKAEKQGPLTEGKIAQAREAGKKHDALYQQEFKKANALLKAYQQIQQMTAKANQNKKKVARTQKELSNTFFQLIEPLILEKIKSLGSPMKSLLRMVGLGKEEESEGGTERVIFKFSDEQIKMILRYKIVFCAKDTVLSQFVATCLRIDKLEDTLFTLATAEALPQKSDIDILFYGPGYSVEDFSDSVKKNRMVAFADEAFTKALMSNEKMKAQTKAMLTKAAQETTIRKPALDAASRNLKALQAKRKQIDNTLRTLEEEQGKLTRNTKAQKEKRHNLLGEQELLESRLAEVDTQFDDIKGRVVQLADSGGKDAAAVLEGSREEMGEALRDELTSLNKNLAHMMFIKGVKDAGESISQNTQSEILQRMEERETYRFKEKPFKKLIVADDGSNTSQNLKRAFISAALGHFKVRDSAVQEMSIKRLVALLENGEGKAYPFVTLLSARPEDEYSEIKIAIKKMRGLSPETFQLLITPFGDLAKADKAGAYYKNLLSLKDHCALVNADIGHADDPAGMGRILKERAPVA